MRRSTVLFVSSLIVVGLVACSPARRGGGGGGDENNGLLNNSPNNATNNGGNNGASCAKAGFVVCGQECVDTSADPEHCGGCEGACGIGGVCADGECATVEDCRQEGCVGLTVCDEGTGRCVRGCSGNGQCGTEGSFCDGTSRSCACDPDRHACDGVCAASDDVATCGDRCSPCPSDPNGATTCEAGACGLTCAPDHLLCDGACAACPTEAVDGVMCDGGACVASACTGRAHVCEGACVSDDDVATCGDRCAPCPDDPRGEASCTRGTCDLACDGGALLCGASCAVCPTTGVTHTTCLRDACVADACAAGRMVCEGACATCPTGASVTELGCDGAACVATACEAGSLVCAGDCAACPTGDAVAEVGCSGAGCVATACAEGALLCEGDCAACPTGAGVLGVACDAAGACVPEGCAEGYVLCDTGCCQWSFDTVGASTPTVIDAVSDAFGELHVVWGVGLGQGVEYGVNDGDGWSIGLVAENAEDPVIALDPDGIPHVVLSRDVNGTSPRVELATRRGPDDWVVELVTDTDASNGSALVYDRAGVPQLAYHVSSMPTQFATVGTTGWVSEPLDAVFSFRFDIALDGQSLLWICYRAAFDDVFCADRASAWSTRRALGEATDTFSLGVYGPAISAAFGGDTLNVAFSRTGDGLVLATVRGETVSSEVLDGGALAGLAVELRVDSRGRRHVAWINHEEGLYYAVERDGTWQVSTVDLFVEPLNYLALTLGPDDAPHLFYRRDGAVRWATLR